MLASVCVPAIVGEKQCRSGACRDSIGTYEFAIDRRTFMVLVKLLFCRSCSHLGKPNFTEVLVKRNLVFVSDACFPDQV